MRIRINYGLEHIELVVPDANVVAGRRADTAPAIADVVRATRQALEEPLSFPPLRQAFTPDDKVSVILSEAFNRLDQLISGTLAYLVEAGLKPSAITMLHPPRVSGRDSFDWRERLPQSLQEVALEEHEPASRRKLSYLASTRAGRRVYLNRTLVDADQLVVIGRIAHDPVMGYGGGLGDVFPAMSDEPTRHEFAGKVSNAVPGNKVWPARQEAQEVGWLLGMPFLLQVIEGAGDEISYVLGGAANAVADEGRRLLDKHWRVAVDRPPDLVVAAISGDPERHHFSDVTRALACAARVVRPGGKIVVLCRSRGTDLGPTAACLRDAENPAEGLRRARDLKLPDTANAWQLASATRQAELYLLSDIPAETAEQLFVTPLAHGNEVQRLVNQAESCLVLPDAHRTMAVLQNSPET